MIDLDHAATTPVEEQVIRAMGECMRAAWANPSAAYREAGLARRELRLCRQTLAGMLHCDHTEVILTSGGTESNNLAVRRAAGRHVVLSAMEHSSVLEAARGWGCDVTLVLPDGDGVIHPEAVEAALRPDTALLALQWANNETGVIQPVEAVGRIAKKRRIPFHVDAVQAFGHIPVDVSCCDTLSLSAHKFGGPRGAGALYVRQGLQLQPILYGGGQENGLRAGTENVAAACGMRVAAQLAAADLPQRAARESALLDALGAHLRAKISGVIRLGEKSARLPGVTALLLPGLSAEVAIARLDLMGVLVSGGAACAASSGAASHVYRAMGLSEEHARQVIRISTGRHTTREDIDTAAEALVQVWEKYHG